MKESLLNQLKNVYVWDIEAYRDHEQNDKFVPYAVGLMPINLLTDRLGNMLQTQDIEKRVKFVKQFHTETAIVDMIKYLNDKHQKI